MSRWIRLTHLHKPQVLFVFSLILAACNQNRNADSAPPAATAIETTSTAQTCQSDLLPATGSLQLTDDGESDVQNNALIIGKEISLELEEYLLADGFSPEQSGFVALVAENSMSNAIAGSLAIDTNPIGDVIVPMVEGAFFSLADPCAALTELSDRTQFTGPIMAGLTGSLNGRTSGLKATRTLYVVESMAGKATSSLGKAGFSGKFASPALDGIVGGTVGSLITAGFDEQTISSAAQSVAFGAVKALAKSGVPAKDVASFAGTIASSAIGGLVDAGLGSDEIMDSGAISSIVEGSIAGLNAAGVETNDISVAIGGITTSAIGSLDELPIELMDLKKLAVTFVISGAMKGTVTVAGKDQTLLRDSIASTMRSAIESLDQVGIEAADISSTVSYVIQTSIENLATIEVKDSTLVAKLATNVVDGAISGAASIAKKGMITEAQLISTSTAAKTGATAGFQKLREDGAITDDAAVTSFNASVASTIVSGLKNSGASQNVVDTVEPEVEDEEEEGEEEVVNTTGPTAALAAPSETSLDQNTSATMSLTFTASPSGGTALTGDLTATGEGLEQTVVSGDPSCTLAVSGITTAGATITIDQCTGDGTFRLTAAAGLAMDALGNLSTASNTSLLFTVATASTARVYIPNGGNNTITVHERDGTLVRTITDAALNTPIAVAVDDAGNVYVNNHGDDKIIKYGPTGNTSLLTFSVQADPFDVALDSAGHIYVTGSNSLREYDALGSLVRTIPSGVSGPWAAAVSPDTGKIYASMNRDNTTAVHIYATSGTTAESTISHVALVYPYYIAMDNGGNFYTANRGPNNVTKFSADGTLLLTITPTQPNTAACDYSGCSIVGVAVDGNGNIYVADRTNHRVIEYAPDGTTINNTITGLTTSGSIMGIAVR